MRKVRAFDKNGEFVQKMHAEAVTEETRRAYDWRCIENACDCSFHWRKAVYAKGNTDPRPPTFVKNPPSKNASNEHALNCAGDIERIARENVKYTTLIDGQIHVRVNLPLGSSNIDRYPKRGDLTEEFKAAIEAQKIIKPFSHIRDLVKFIEKNFGALDSEAASEIMVNYQGKAVEWGKLFKGSDNYAALLHRSKNRKDVDGNTITPPIITVLRPLKELEPNQNGKRRFECEGQTVKIVNRRHSIIPVIVDSSHDGEVSKKINYQMKQGATLIATARPFFSPTSIRNLMSELRIYLNVYKMEQVEPVSDKYWKISGRDPNQFDLFDRPRPAI